MLLYNAHYHFRTNHSIECVTLELVERIIIEMDKINTQVNIIVDLSKVFHNLDHEILLHRLKYYAKQVASIKHMKIYIKRESSMLT